MKNSEILSAGEPARGPVRCQKNLPRRILVVDDDSGIRQLSAEALSCFGYHVETAEDGADGWEALQASGYDLLITDYCMPRMSGIDLLKKMRSAHVDLPVIMVTSALPEHEFAQSPSLLPDATLLKPFTVAELLGTVREFLWATDSDREQNELRPTGRSQPAADSLRL